MIPLFYQRDAQGIPRQWIQTIRRAMVTLVPQFTTDAHGAGIHGEVLSDEVKLHEHSVDGHSRMEFIQEFAASLVLDL